MNITSSKDDYVHGTQSPCSSDYLNPAVFNVVQDLGIHKLLDIGCGNGSLCNYLSINGGGGGKMQLVGLEPSLSGVENARSAVPNAKFYCMGVYDNPADIAESDFDAAIATEVIEHLFYPRELLRFAKAKLKPDGYVILTTPYHGYLKNMMMSIFNKWDKHHTVLWDGGHIKFWSRQTLSQLMNEEGFDLYRFEGCGRIPYLWKSMLLVGKLRS